MDAMLRDIKLAIRALLRVPLFTAVAVITLGAGIGTTTLMFTTANAAFLQPLPFPSEGLVRVWQVSPRSNQVAIAVQVWRDWQALTSFTRLTASLGAGAVNASHGSDAERLTGARVSRNFFDTLGVRPALGRTFTVEEATANGPVAVVISDALWERFFGRDPDVLTRTIAIEGVAHPIVGVMPPGITYPQNADLWTAFERYDTFGPSRTSHNLEVIGRLAPGSSIASAQAETETFTRALHEADAQMRSEGYGVRVADFRTDLLDGSGQSVALLMAAVGCLLLIACVNVVNLLLSRSVSRQDQTTLRIALGASRRDIVRVFLMESLVLALAGGVSGALLMIWAGALADGLIPAALRPAGALRPDAAVFAVLALLTLVVGVVCGLIPARYAAALQLRPTLAAGSQGIASEPRAMRVLVGLEVALGVMLRAGAGLLLNSLLRLERIDPGFRREGAVVASFALGNAEESEYAQAAARARFFDRLLERTAADPRIDAAGVTSSFPFTFSPNALLEEDGVPPGQWGVDPATEYRVVGGQYFGAMGTPIKAGRSFTDADRGGAPLVAMVNEAAARILWNGQSPLGRRVRMVNMDRVQEFATIVGVVGDVRHRGLTRPPRPEVYFPYAQRPQRTFAMTLVAASALDATAVTTTLRAAVRSIDPSVPVRVMPVGERIGAQLAAARFRTRLLAGFAAVAVALAAFGIFGVVSYSVAMRRKEMGIRLALGASAMDLRRLVLRRALVPVAIGLFAGLNAAILASRLVAGLLFGVERTDPLTYGVAVGLLLAVAVLAALVPAHRATRVNPLTTLRAE
jgi:putative ABC transport system permease protein